MSDLSSTEAFVAADLNDGVTARRHEAQVTWGPEGLGVNAGTLAESVAWSELIWIDLLPEAILLGRRDRPGWRLRLGRDAPADLVARLPQRPRFGQWIDRFGFGKSLAGFIAVSSMVALVAINTPNWLGRRVPMSWEAGMSDDNIEDLSANTCRTPASDAALAKLSAMLDYENKDGSLPPVKIEIIKLDMVNAVALPGGRVLVFDGLLKQIDSPDVLAGVIGHEIGHVRERHVMQAMLREFGISMVLSGFKSGVTNTLGRMAALSYSREAESEADVWARASLAQASVSPVPTAGFFTASADEAPYAQYAMAAYLNSHPDPASRADAFRGAFRRDQTYRPALTVPQFAAVQTACEDDLKMKPLMAGQ